MNKLIIDNLDQFIFHKDKIKKCKQWLEDFKNNKHNTKKILLIIGNTGIGKTFLAEHLFKYFNYKIYEFNSSDIRSKKRIGEIFRKSFTYHSVLDMFNNKQCSTGILIDELETLCKNGDKGSMAELNIIMKENSKDKGIINNPIIATCQDINDKKLIDFKKLCEIVYLKNPSNFELEKFIDQIIKINDISIDIDAKLILIKKCNGDINQLLFILEDLYSRVINSEKIINLELVERVIKSYDEKIIDYQLNEIINKLLYKKISINDSINLFQTDCLLIPLILHQNIIKRINNTKLTNKDKWIKLSKILNNLSINDIIQTTMFESNEWENLFDISGFYGTTLPNYECYKLDKKSSNESNYIVEYSMLLNKTSQMYINKKLISESPNLFNNYYFEKDNLYFIVENINKLLYGNNNDLMKLANFMKKYNITLSELEEIIKIDKLNLSETEKKNKKKLTMVIKKNLEKMLN